MEAKVVDASAIAAVLFSEPQAGIVEARIAGVRLVAPILLEFELAQVCLKKVRRHPQFREQWRAAHRLRTDLRIEYVGIDSDQALGLAETTRLSAYDASYLLLARALDAELVTLDHRLAAAAVM